MRMTRICTNIANSDANKNHNPNYTNKNKIQNSKVKSQNYNSKVKTFKILSFKLKF